MKTIWKYVIEITDRQKLTVPGDAKIIHAGLDPSATPCVWVEVTPAASDAQIEIYIFGTGNPMDARAIQHHGSFVMGEYVWHVYSS